MCQAKAPMRRNERIAEFTLVCSSVHTSKILLCKRHRTKCQNAIVFHEVKQRYAEELFPSATEERRRRNSPFVYREEKLQPNRIPLHFECDWFE